MSCEEVLWCFESYVPMDLHTAASLTLDSVMENIWESSEDKSIVNQPNRVGWTPLMYTACYDHLSTAKWLIEKGASPSFRDGKGMTPLMVASKWGCIQTLSLFLEHGANIEARDSKGWTPLFYAVYHGQRSVLQLLLQKNCRVHVKDINSVTPIMIAKESRQEEIVQVLMAHVDVPKVPKLNLPSLRSNVRILSCSDMHLKQSGIDCDKQLVMDLSTVLSNLGLSKYFPIFQKNGIDMVRFWTLTDDDLKNIGIGCLGPRRKITAFIAKGLPHINQLWKLNQPLVK